MTDSAHQRTVCIVSAAADVYLVCTRLSFFYPFLSLSLCLSLSLFCHVSHFFYLAVCLAIPFPLISFRSSSNLFALRCIALATGDQLTPSREKPQKKEVELVGTSVF